MGRGATQYAKTSDGVHIAYQVVGGGLVDPVYLAPHFSHLEINWGSPDFAAFLARLAFVPRRRVRTDESLNLRCSEEDALGNDRFVALAPETFRKV